jgi:PilZ domain
MNERRRHHRYEVSGIQATLAERHPCDVLLLSRGGMLLTTGFEPPLGHVLDLAMPIGPEVFRSAARVVFVGEDRSAPRTQRYRVGVAFAIESDTDADLLDRYIRNEIEPAAGAPA